MSDSIDPKTAQRYCPSCGKTSNAEFCPDDGVATLKRETLTVDATQLRAGDVIEGRYRITGILGRGGFGAVYAAEHTGTQQQVALKMMLPNAEGSEEDEVRRFYREAQVTASLRHANTVRVFDVGQTAKGALYIAMEMLRGPTLAAHLKKRLAAGGPLSEHETIDIALPILRSLHEAHKKGLVHRDLKPANIMLTRLDEDEDEDEEVVVKVLDFGIARPQDSSLTGAGTSLGTPAYMSPEQCQGKTLDGRSDLYSLGVILFLCTTGRVPFEDRNPLTVMFKHASEAVPDLHKVAPAPLTADFVACVHRSLAKQPHERFAAARPMRLALEAVRAGRPLPADDARSGSSSGIPALQPAPVSSSTVRLGSASSQSAPAGGTTRPYVETPSERAARIDVGQGVSVDDETTAHPATPAAVSSIRVIGDHASGEHEATMAAPSTRHDVGDSATVAGPVTAPQGSVPEAEAAPEPEPAAAPARRTPVAVWVGVALAVAVAAFGGFALRGGGEATNAPAVDSAPQPPTAVAPAAVKPEAVQANAVQASAAVAAQPDATAPRPTADAGQAAPDTQDSADTSAAPAKRAARRKRVKRKLRATPARETAKKSPPQVARKPAPKPAPKPADKPVQRFFLD